METLNNGEAAPASGAGVAFTDDQARRQDANANGRIMGVSQMSR